MQDNAEMKLIALASSEKDGLRLEVLASPLLLVPIEGEFNPWAYTARLRVTNLRAESLIVNHADGAIARNSFANTSLVDKGASGDTTEHEVFRRGGPIDPSRIINTSKTLATGESLEIGGDPTYVMWPIQLARDQVSASGKVEKVPSDVREFTLRFAASFSIGAGEGPKLHTSQFSVPLTVKMVRE